MMPRSLLILGLLSLTLTLTQAASLNRAGPAFTLKNSKQAARSLANYKGKVVFINFWASWCAPCQQELPELNKLAQHYQGKPVQVLAINVDQDLPAGLKTLTRLGLQNPSFEVLWDTQSKIVSAYDVPTMPSSFVLDQRGVVRALHKGFHSGDPAQWRQEINRLLK